MHANTLHSGGCGAGGEAPVAANAARSGSAVGSRCASLSLILGLGVALGSCTLTHDEFEPVLVESVAAQPVGVEPSSAPPSPAPSCLETLECPAGFECSGQGCVPRGCGSQEGGAAQDFAACAEPPCSCAEPPCSCAEPLCPDGACAAPSSCDDGQLGGEETGVDCGGPCAPCEPAGSCVGNGDCVPGTCVEGTCAAPSCSDGVTNQDESGADCGGASCPRCPSSLGCREGSDCESGLCGGAGCAEGIAACCQLPSCEDGVQNGGETAPDCGNDACGPCAAEPVCGDGTQNGDESAVDCGGSELGCARCLDGQACATVADCASGRCDGGSCSSCGDGLENGDESGIDCGSSEPGCPACVRCGVNDSIDLGTTGAISSLAGNACARITMFPGYAPTLLESSEGGTYPVPFSWRQDCTGQTGTGVFEGPFDQLILAGLSVACPMILDFTGPSDSFQMRWF